MNSQFLPQIHRQVQAENKIAAQLRIARTTRNLKLLSASLREIGRLMAEEKKLIGNKEGIESWIAQVERRTGITAMERVFAFACWDKFQSRQTRPMASMRN